MVGINQHQNCLSFDIASDNTLITRGKKHCHETKGFFTAEILEINGAEATCVDSITKGKK